MNYCPFSPMKYLTVVLALLLPLSAFGHDETKKVKMPNGGRHLAKPSPAAEFLVQPDRRVRVTFVDDAGAPVPATEQAVTVTAGDRSAPTKLTFVRAGDVLLSEQALPAGNDFPAVVQVKANAEARPVVERFHINLSVCGECQLAEYACVCSHGHDEHAH